VGVCDGVPGGVTDGVGDFDNVAEMEGVCVGVCVGEVVIDGVENADWLALGYSTFEIIRTTLLFESEKYKFPYAVSMQR
jgi:hypothetical protein